jgi:hypothetical protein
MDLSKEKSHGKVIWRREATLLAKTVLLEEGEFAIYNFVLNLV